MTTIAPTFRVYRGVDNIIDNTQNPNTWRASATYVTGAHNMKFGYRGAYHVEQTTDLSNDAGYTSSLHTTTYAVALDESRLGVAVLAGG